MKWVRSYPAETVTGRSWVIDTHAQPFRMTNYDYRDLITLDDDVLLLEWDMAVSREDMITFEEHAANTPASVLVAPYLLYAPDAAPHFAHRVVENANDGGVVERWVKEPDKTRDDPREDWEADLFGFGMIYLPHDLIRKFLDAPVHKRGRAPWLLPEQGYSDDRLTDQTFSIWYRCQLDRRTAIDWSVRPIHLHW